jgi:hypothetical protein
VSASEEPQKQYQLKLPAPEIDRLANKVQMDYRAAIGDHRLRMGRFREYYRRWRALPDQPSIGDEEKSNFAVPLIRWNALTKLAKEMDSLFGDDAEIVAIPTGPSDQKKVTKIGKYMTWRVLNSMKLTNPFTEFVLRKILFGKSHAYAPWKREAFEIEGKEVVDYEGPGFEPLWPDDLIVPAEEVRSVQDFSFVIRRYRVTPDELLQGEAEGRYQGITENFSQIVQMAARGLQREFEGEEVKLEADEAEGIIYQRPLSSGETVMVIEWYGKWRPLKKGQTSADEWDFSKREMRQGDWCVRFLWDLNMIISVQDLAELYPTLRKRRPFVESSFMVDGRYWPPGLCELLIDAEDELKQNHNKATDAGDLSCKPCLVYRPASGFEPETLKLEAGLCIPVDNVNTDIKVIEIPFNGDYAQWKEQTILAYVERLTGMSDMSLGRASDRPNAPKTARQTVALLEEGNVRISLDTKVLQEDMALVLQHFWQLEWAFSPPQTFFRVTEDDANGLFPVKDGGAWITEEDRDGRYDFRLKFANSVWSREAGKEKTLARYQIDMQNPLIIQNPAALWEITNEVHSALGDDNFASLVPKPPAPDAPCDPKQEWSRLQEGEQDVHVNPQDNDQLHMIRHMRDIQSAQGDPACDKQALQMLIAHYMQHVEQLQQKKIVQAVAEHAMAAASQLNARSQGALGPTGQLFQPLPGMPPGNPGAQPPAIYPNHPEVGHEQ